jgi:hypothetical protein
LWFRADRRGFEVLFVVAGGQISMSSAAQLRPSRVLACLLVLLTGPALLPASSASAAEGSSAAAASTTATRLSGFIRTPAAVRVGGELWNAVTVLPRASRTVTVQYRRAGTTRFTNAYTGKASTQGRFNTQLMPHAAGVWQFRLVVAATPRADKLVSTVRTVRASGAAATTKLEGFVSTAATVTVGGAVTDVVAVLPRARRTVWVQARRPGAPHFETLTTGTSSDTGAFTAVYRPSTAGVWAYRLTVPARATARMAVSPTRTVTVSQPTPAPTSTSTPTPTPTPASTTTVAAPTTAALSINGSTGSTAKQTVNLSEAFVVTGTHAGPGLTLLSGSLDYGDGKKDTFSGDSAWWMLPDHQYTGQGPVTATLTVMDSAFVIVSTQVVVTVYEDMSANISLPAGESLETGKPITFDLTSVKPPGTAYTDYDSFTVDDAGVVDNFAAGVGPPPATLTLTFATAGTYTVFIDVYNDAEGWAPVSTTVDVP